MSPEESVALERRVYVIPRNGDNGPEIFVQVGRQTLVVPLGPLTILQIAEFCEGWKNRLLRRAFVEAPNAAAAAPRDLA